VARYVVVAVPGDGAELVADLLWQIGAEAIEERAAGERAAGERIELVTSFPPDRYSKAVAALRSAGHAPVEVEVDEAAYADAWRPFAEAVRVGERVVVEPRWQPTVARPGDIAVRIDPGRAFGSGAHPSTRLVLDELVARVRPGDRVLDVGCGSGVLAVVAAALGATVTAVDVDPEAVRATAANARANGVAVAVSDLPLTEVNDAFDLVCANLLAPIVLALAPELRRVVAGAGTLVVSGLLAGRWRPVAAALAPLEVRSVGERDGWASLVLSPPG
jgi:ribosomal protein L11 methyltransferase